MVLVEECCSVGGDVALLRFSVVVGLILGLSGPQRVRAYMPNINRMCNI